METDAPSPHKSVTTKTAVALRGYKTERESRIDDDYKRGGQLQRKRYQSAVWQRFCRLEWQEQDEGARLVDSDGHLKEIKTRY